MTTTSPTEKPGMLYAASHALRDHRSFALYRPFREIPDHIHTVGLFRDMPGGSFSGPVTNVRHNQQGEVMFDAPSARGNQSTCTYVLLRQAGFVNKETGEITPGDTYATQLIGMMREELDEVDPRPGLYYVTAHQEGGRPKTARLLGPFAWHLDALLHRGDASRYAIQNSSEAVWWSFGTARGRFPASPIGAFNDRLLPEEARAVYPMVIRKAKYATLTIADTTTAAFQDIGRNAEIGRIIGEAADRIKAGSADAPFVLKDANGNDVGRFEIVTDPCMVMAGAVEGSGRVSLWVKAADTTSESRRAVDLAEVLHRAAYAIQHNTESPLFVLKNAEGEAVCNVVVSRSEECSRDAEVSATVEP